MIRAALILICFFGFLQRAWAYPISPRPLRLLVTESKHIVVGYVISTFDKKEEKKKKKNHYYPYVRVARIAVLECLQGKMMRDTIELEFSPNMTCPAPPNYIDSTHVLCFLNEDEDGTLYTHALSYGSKTMPLNDIAVYKARIKELQLILQQTDEAKKHTETLDWLVSCAEHQVTRWEGIFELWPESDFMSYYSNDLQEAFNDSLTPAQQKRLYQALLNTGELYYSDFGLIDMVYKGNEMAIDALLLRNLKALREDDYWIAEKYLERLRYHNLTAEMRKIMEQFEALRNDINFYDKKAEIKAIIDTFIKLIDPL